MNNEIIECELDYTPSRPDGLIAMAVERDLDINKLEKLLELKRQWDQDNARKAFFKALSKFQSEIPPIVRHDKVNAGTGGKRKFANLGTISEAIKPHLEANKLSFRFRQSQSAQNEIALTCIISHADGHSEETTLTAAPDQTGGKNTIQAVGSTITYLMRYTLIGGLGLTTVDDDTDGEPTPQKTGVSLTSPCTEKMQLRIKEAAQKKGITLEQLSASIRAYGVQRLAELTVQQANELSGRIEMQDKQPSEPPKQAGHGVRLSGEVQPQSLDSSEVRLDGPCSADHADMIRHLGQQLDIPVEAIKAMIERRGKQRLAELTILEAEEIIRKLERKLREEEIPF